MGVSHSGQQPQALEEQAGSGAGANYSNTFLAIPSTVTYRPLKTIEKPYVRGLQTATVVGRKGEEIHTDEWGRVAVQFHWDRLGKNDENSSCWIRVGQMWGGVGWGAQFIPRVGDEVLVDFMEGDPDWPIIVGSVYNEANQPIYDLKNNKTQSGIKTRSYPDGPGFNELRFEDKKGEEHVYLQGEKDWNILIKNDKGQNVGHDETLSVANNRTKTVGANQRETIGANKEIQVGANHTETIGANMSLTVAQSKTGVRRLEYEPLRRGHQDRVGGPGIGRECGRRQGGDRRRGPGLHGGGRHEHGRRARPGRGGGARQEDDGGQELRHHGRRQRQDHLRQIDDRARQGRPDHHQRRLACTSRARAR